ncbi:hypothetical protein H0H81_005931 [Sphagnurus paluster]|uniref:ATP synthase F(0) complex subunit e, mitochondrial n=1 Tax=Sphagnurus paluster TaxID=117069 RepID=A0A9P7KH35_9AGAR|nr:hypothetical protein H0H81_005931 [Sphagnurus paluster]
MVSATVNVVRYTALFTGVLYGFYHHRTLQAQHDQHKAEHALHTRERLITEAKEAWKRQKESKNSNDTEDPRFDLEKVLLSLDKAS